MFYESSVLFGTLPKEVHLSISHIYKLTLQTPFYVQLNRNTSTQKTPSSDVLQRRTSSGEHE